MKQGSEEWHRARLGVMTASNAEYILAKKGTQGRQTYINKLVAQILTGQWEEISAPALAWGNENEDAAHSAYAFTVGEKAEKCSFIYGDETKRTGASPDGKTATKFFEIKCPFNSANYVDFVACGKIKPEWMKQVQFSMWVTGQNVWDFVQYDPRVTQKMIHIVTIEKDAETHKLFDDAVPQMAMEIDIMLDVFGAKFGEQWTD